MSKYIKLMQKQAAEERQREQERAAEAAPPTIPAPGGEPDRAQSAVPVEKPAYRPQPFTPDLIPEPKEIEAEGELTAQETGDLANCEQAFAYADQAEWMRGKAAHAVRSRRLYRSGGRLWPEYCEEVLGQSESEVNRMIQQWRLARAIFQLWTRPTPASHVQALLPAVEAYGEEQIASGYVDLRAWAAESGTRITAADLTGLVKRARAAVKKQDAPPALSSHAVTQVREDRERQALRAVARKQLPGPGQTVAAGLAGAGPEENHSTLNHPNLGDWQPPLAETATQVPAASGDEAGEERAVRAWSVLEGMAEGMVAAGILRGASTATLKEIERTARGLADAAAEILKER